MRPIPKKLRDDMSKDHFMKRCCLCGEKPQWHHSIIYRGRQLQQAWAIVPACEKCHKTRLDELELVALNRATDEELLTISKVVDYKQRREYLNFIINGECQACKL